MNAKNDKSFTLERIFNAPKEMVFEAFTKGEHLTQWWGPRGFSAPDCRVDPRKGGALLLCMRTPQGDDYWCGGHFQEVTPFDRIVWTIYFSDEKGKLVPGSHYGMPADIPSKFVDIFAFESLPGGKTKLTLTRDIDPELGKRIGMGEGWLSSLDKLADMLDRQRGLNSTEGV